MAHPAHRGLWLGAAAGILTASADWCGQAGYLPGGLRGALAWRLASAQVPTGALLGALLGGCWSLTAGRGTLPPGRLALARSLPLWPGAIWLGAQLVSGGTMSRLPAVGAIQLGLTLALLASLWALLRGCDAALDWARSGPAPDVRAALPAASALGACCGLSLADQRILPGHYEYLHATLSLLALACAGFAVAALTGSHPVARRATSGRPAPWVQLLAGAGMLGALGLHLTSLDRSQVLRASLVAPLASHNHSLMLVARPLLARRDALAQRGRAVRASRARKRRTDAPVDATLPSWPDAHVLLITVDALRADHLGAYGYERGISPAIDALAADAVVFEHAYTPAPHSSHALSSMMSSEYVHQTVEAGQPLPEHTLASLLREAAYDTRAFFTDGIFHTDSERFARYKAQKLGFERAHNGAPDAELLTDLALSALAETVERGEPSSLWWVHYFDVHAPYRPGPLGSEDVDRYDGEIARADRAIGRLLRGARKLLKRPVVVVLTADHGEAFREHGDVHHGSSLYEEQLRVPLIVAAPGLPARRVRSPVNLVDLAPTTLAMLGLPAGPQMRGRDLRPLAVGRPATGDPVFASFGHTKMALRWPHKLIADLRFGVRELYDLAADPGERHNLADADPEQVERLREDLYAWLDGLGPVEAAAPDPWQLALRRGRMLDRRAIPGLGALLRDPAAPGALRLQAARVLARLANDRAGDALAAVFDSARDPGLLAEVAIALGRLRDARARPALQELVRSDDRVMRTRAAVSLGRLGDMLAVPALLEAVETAPKLYTRREAVRCLGQLGDPVALPALRALADHPELGHVALVAIGRLGAPGGFETLRRALEDAHQADRRDRAVWGLGLLSDPRALPVLADLLGNAPELAYAAESLVRLGALEAGLLGGMDAAKGAAKRNQLSDCVVAPDTHDWNYLHGTHCLTTRRRTRLRLTVPVQVAEASYGSDALLTLRRTDARAPTQLEVRIGNRPVDTVRVAGEWVDLHWSLPPGALPAGEHRAVLTAAEDHARFAVDHLLIIPRRTEASDAHGG